MPETAKLVIALKMEGAHEETHPEQHGQHWQDEGTVQQSLLGPGSPCNLSSPLGGPHSQLIALGQAHACARDQGSCCTRQQRQHGCEPRRADAQSILVLCSMGA